MKNLGKIVLFILIIPNILFAGVTASVDYSRVTMGETVTYSITTSGNNIQRPMLSRICGSNVTSTSSRTSIEMINGNYERTKVLSYEFMPQKSCTIAPIKVVVDGKEELTKALRVEVKPASQDKSANFVIELKADKKELFVGEPFKLVMLVKQRHGTQAVDSKFIAPKMEGFWKSGDPKQEKYDDGEFIITKLTYKLSAQRDGNLTITSAQLAVASRSNKQDMWGSFMQDLKWKSYFSNELHFSVKPIPQNAKFIGDFSINATVDKQEINPNEAVNVTIEVSGKGNLEDITKFKPYIQGVSVFDEKPVVKGNKFVEKIALVGDNDFVIPPFSLEFFNPNTQKLEKISSKEIAIKVNGATPKHELKIKRDNSTAQPAKVVKEVVVHKQTSPLILAIVFLSGLMIGIGIMLAKPWKFISREKSLDIKDEKKLLVKLMPFSEDKDVQDIIDILDYNIYSKDKKELDKKLLKEIIKKYSIV